MVVTVTGAQRSPGSRAELLFLIAHAGVFPVLGAALAVWAFSTVLRGALPWPVAVLDTIAVLCGAAGLLAGGIGDRARRPSSVARGRRVASPGRARWSL